MKIAGRCVLLCDAKGSIAGATALALARKGAFVILSGGDRPALEALRQRVDESGARSRVLACDLAEEGGPARLIAQAIDSGSKIDVLIIFAEALSFGVRRRATPRRAEDLHGQRDRPDSAHQCHASAHDRPRGGKDRDGRIDSGIGRISLLRELLREPVCHPRIFGIASPGARRDGR
jgi:NAD(P)-dependent dehydrogenase (short-subunit alcohol dehydrogenase family)